MFKIQSFPFFPKLFSRRNVNVLFGIPLYFSPHILSIFCIQKNVLKRDFLRKKLRKYLLKLYASNIGTWRSLDCGTYRSQIGSDGARRVHLMLTLRSNVWYFLDNCDQCIITYLDSISWCIYGEIIKLLV